MIKAETKNKLGFRFDAKERAPVRRLTDRMDELPNDQPLDGTLGTTDC